MRIKKMLALILSAVMALAVFAGCGKNNDYSRVAVQVIAQLMEDGAELNLTADSDLMKALQDTVQNGGGDISTIRNLMLQALGIKDTFSFSEAGAAAAKDGQHAVPVCRVTGKTPEEAVRNAFAQMKNVLDALPSDGKYKTRVSMVKEGDDYYIALDLLVVQAGQDDGTGEGTQKPQEPEEPTLDDYGKLSGTTFIIDSNVQSLDGFDDLIIEANTGTKNIYTVNFSNYKGTIPANVLKKTGIDKVIVSATSKVESGAFADTGRGTKLLTIEVTGMNSIDSSILGGAQEVSLVLKDAINVGNTFSECHQLVSISLPKANNIDVSAFWGCNSLASVYLGANANVQAGAFSNCGNLKVIYYAGSNIPDWSGIGWQYDYAVIAQEWAKGGDTTTPVKDNRYKYLVYDYFYGVPELTDNWPNVS